MPNGYYGVISLSGLINIKINHLIKRYKSRSSGSRRKSRGKNCVLNATGVLLQLTTSPCQTKL